MDKHLNNTNPAATTFTPKRYERISLKRGAASNYTGATRFYLEVTGENDKFLRGYEVGKDGGRIWGAKFDERLRLIDKSIIDCQTPQVMNNFYAQLEDKESVSL